MRPSTPISVALTVCLALVAFEGGAERRRRAPKITAPFAQRGAARVERLSEQTARIRLIEEEQQITIKATHPITIVHKKGSRKFSPRTWTFKITSAVRGREQYHLFIKSFKPNEGAKARKFLAAWTSKGYDPELITMGKRFRTRSGEILDNRSHWVSLRRFPTLDEAEALQRDLNRQDIYGWIRNETLKPGTATVSLAPLYEAPIAVLHPPFTLESTAPIVIQDIDGGFWNEQRRTLTFAGTIEITVTPGGKLQAVESLSVEDYLAGVVPAEMPSLWPLEALKAQALAARSEVIASLETKHLLEGFDFCNKEHCRAYLGYHEDNDRALRAVRETRGQLLTKAHMIIPAVFSSNCGGWTENNDTVWSGPPNSVLRATSDLAESHGNSPANIGGWLRTEPDAFCSADNQYYRWKRTFSESELSKLINGRYPIGRIRRIELGERGPGGRLKWVRLVGGLATETVRKDLAIRRALGALPSAMFIMEKHKRGGEILYTFIGGGRGHGVGLCQHGARGMALEGMGYEQIVRHYYEDVAIDTYL